MVPYQDLMKVVNVFFVNDKTSGLNDKIIIQKTTLPALFAHKMLVKREIGLR